ncbi:MAG: serine hydrolase domain-containing protein [Candidatus Thorarchaeota archaeon]|jgi:CubicO group peptidase (beta-lactamase class C family)
MRLRLRISNRTLAYTGITILILLSSVSFGTAANELPLHRPLADRDYWPTDGWLNSTPEDQGMDSSKFQDMMNHIEDDNTPIKSIVIVRNGRIVLEEFPLSTIYDENSTHLLFSVTKSFTSALIGIALDKGYIDNVSQTMLSFFPDYNITNPDERRERVTIEHLLTMRSGIFWDETTAPYNSPANGIYHMNTGDGVEYTLNLDMVAEPGELWHYNTGASHILAAIVQVASGMTTLEFAEEYLFGPLGITEARWYRDIAGWYKGGFDLKMTTRSMAKFGYLYLNNGSWDGEQIVSSQWVNTSTSSITRFSDHGGYGYQWWTIPSLGLYRGAGLYGQYIYVIPEYDIVVAFSSTMGPNDAYPHDSLVADFIIPAVIEDTSQLDAFDILNVSLLAILVAPVVLAGGYWLVVVRRAGP